MDPRLPSLSHIEALAKNAGVLPAMLGALLTLIAIVVGVTSGDALSSKETPLASKDASTITVLTAKGTPAGTCTISGLPEERMHYTDSKGVYFYTLKPGTYDLNASCRNALSLSSASGVANGNQTVTVGDAPVNVTIIVR